MGESMSIIGVLIFLIVFCLIMFGACVAAAVCSLRDDLYGVAAFEIALAFVNVMYFVMSLIVYQAIK